MSGSLAFPLPISESVMEPRLRKLKTTIAEMDFANYIGSGMDGSSAFLLLISENVEESLFPKSKYFYYWDSPCKTMIWSGKDGSLKGPLINGGHFTELCFPEFKNATKRCCFRNIFALRVGFYPLI